jgi:hypothetical protein
MTELHTDSSTATLFNSPHNPFEALHAALAQARREQKNILISVGGDWCIWYHRLEQFIETHPELQQLRRDHYVTIHLSLSDTNEFHWAFMRQLPEIDAVPHLFVYNNQGTLLCSQPTDPLEQGESYAYDRVRAFLTEWSDAYHHPQEALSIEALRQRFAQFLGFSQPRLVVAA